MIVRHMWMSGDFQNVGMLGENLLKFREKGCQRERS